MKVLIRKTGFVGPDERKFRLIHLVPHKLARNLSARTCIDIVMALNPTVIRSECVKVWDDSDQTVWQKDYGIGVYNRCLGAKQLIEDCLMVEELDLTSYNARLTIMNNYSTKDVLI